MRVEQEFEFLGNILKQVRTGDIAPAPMQRPYVWSRPDVEAICHSIIMGYPIGGILAWRPDRDLNLEIPVNRLGPIVPENKARVMILDGHNRLATFAWISAQGQEVENPSDAERETWYGEERLVLDVDQKKIRFVSPEEKKEILWIGAETLLSYDGGAVRRRYQEMSREGCSEADIDRMLNLHQDFNHAMMQAKASMTTIANATPEEAKDAFLAICRTGVPMSEEDFDYALSWINKPDESLHPGGV